MIAWATNRIDQIGRVVTWKDTVSERPERVLATSIHSSSPSDIPATTTSMFE